MPTDYIRVRTSGVPEFVRSNSFSHRQHHHHHHRRHRCHDDCSGVSWTEYNHVLEQNRNFSQWNAALVQERDSLTSELNKATQANRAWSEESARLLDVNARLSSEVEALKDELGRTRRSCSSDDDNVKGFKRRIKALEKELRDQERRSSAEIRELKEDVEKSNTVAHQWKRKYEELKRVYDSASRRLFDKTAQLERCEETIREQSHTIRRLRELLERYRGW